MLMQEVRADGFRFDSVICMRRMGRLLDNGTALDTTCWVEDDAVTQALPGALEFLQRVTAAVAATAAPNGARAARYQQEDFDYVPVHLTAAEDLQQNLNFTASSALATQHDWSDRPADGRSLRRHRSLAIAGQPAEGFNSFGFGFDAQWDQKLQGVLIGVLLNETDQKLQTWFNTWRPCRAAVLWLTARAMTSMPLAACQAS